MAISAWKPFLVQYFTQWWKLQLMPHLDWIQIDVTSRCNALCSYCPRTVYLSRWNNRDLSPDTFEAPVISVAYLLLRSHLPDIGGIIPRLKGLGIQQMTISTLDFVACKDLRKELLLPENEGEYRKLKSLLDGLVRDGERAEILVNYHLVSPGKRNQICTENPRRSLFVSADGSISPCVFLNIPAPGSSRVTGEGECEYQRLTFGNLSSESLPAIWKSQCYKEFRNSFDSTPHPFCLKCPKLHEV